MASHRILVVDHEPHFANLVSEILKQDGYETLIEGSSATAIQNASKFQPQLLVIDPRMPGLSGVEAAARIARQTKCKVLFLTTLHADTDFREMLRGLRQQGCDCEALPKPFSKEQALENVRRRIGTAQIITEAEEAYDDAEYAQQHYRSGQPGQTGPRSGKATGQDQNLSQDNTKQSPVWPFSSSEPPAYKEGSDDYEALLKASRVDLYQTNAFRITGLNVDSSLRDISREAEKLEMMIKLGTTKPSTGIFPLEEPSSIATIKSALQTLKDPEQRLLHEFFWFWPCAASSKDDPALQALGQRKYQVAVDVWTATKGKGNGIATHNLAVFYQLGVLDQVNRRTSGTLSPSAGDQILWNSAYQCWKKLLVCSDFWDSLVSRIREINDPRLPIDTAHQIWSSLPSAILGINVHLAIAAAERGDFEGAGRHRRLLFASEWQDYAKRAIHRALKPLREDIERLCERAENDARLHPKTANLVVRKLFLEKDKLVNTLNYLIGVDDPMCAAAHDRVAEAGRVGIVAYVNETDDWKTAELLLEECLKLAQGKALQSKLESDFEIITSHLAAQREGHPTPSSQQAPQRGDGRSDQTRAQAATPIRSLHRKVWWSGNNKAALICIALFILFVASKACQDNTPPQKSVRGPSTSEPKTSPTLPSAGGSYQRGLTAQIEADQLRLRRLESNLRQLKSELDNYESNMTSDKASLEQMARNNDLGLEVDADQYETIRSRFNNNVSLYNEELKQYNSILAEYRQLLASTNAKIDAYNSLGRAR